MCFERDAIGEAARELATFGRGLAVALTKRQGALAATPGAFAARRSAVLVRPRRLAALREVLALPPGPAPLPPTAPEALLLPLLAEIATSPSFPLSPLGLIHVRQTIELLRTIGEAEPLDLEATVVEFRSIERGVEVDIEGVASVGAEPVWRGVTTLLSRSRAARARDRAPRRRERRTAPPKPRVVVEVAADTGRRYATASGDWSPHHLTAATALVVGFRRPIAHGMWTLGRALAAMPNPGAPFRVEATFKRPLPMPGRVALGWEPSEEGATRFEVWDPTTRAPHLDGTMVAGS
ncbi:MAG: MaoC/PaaZ C-terminal domain-containing protein [Myxococcota bacterium]